MLRSVKVLQCLIFSGVLWLAFSCGSQSLLSDRFSESASLSSPSPQVNLSDPNHFSFAMVGDLHVGLGGASRFNEIATQASGEGDSFIILLGDTADQGAKESIDSVQSVLSGIGWQNRVLYVIGNHDIFSDGWSHFKTLEGPTHYTVTIGNSEFIALDTADGNVGKDQMSWLLGELKKSRPTNTFLISHYMPVVPNQRTYLRLSDENEAMKLMKMATNYQVRGWFGGHYHSYLNSNIEGVDYVVAGGGGGRRMDPLPVYFFIQVSVNNDQISYTFHEVP